MPQGLECADRQRRELGEHDPHRPFKKVPRLRHLPDLPPVVTVDAVREIRSTALFSSTVDWDAVDRGARAVLDTASCYADTHTFVTTLLK